jgi:hypothetical protein
MKDLAVRIGRTDATGGIWLTGIRVVIHPIAIAIAVAGIVVVRISPQLAQPRFLLEDAVGWWAPAVIDPVGSLLTTWNGFAYPFYRLCYLVARLVSSEGAPLVPLVITTICIALVAGFVASDRLAAALPDRRVRLGSAVAIALLPFDNAGIYTMLNLQWFGTIYLAALLLATPAPTIRWRITDRLGALLVATSTPSSLVVLPLFLIRRHQLDRIVIAAIGVGAAFELLVFAGAERHSWIDASLLGAAALRLGIAPLGDYVGRILIELPAPGAALAAVILSAAVLASERLPRSTGVVLALVSAAFALVGMSNFWPDIRLDPWQGARYLIFGAWSLMTLTLAGLVGRRRTTVVIALAFAVGVATTFRQTPKDDGVDWGCAGTPRCVVGPPNLRADLSGATPLPVGIAINEGWIYPR